MVLLVIIIILATWQLTSPHILPVVGSKYTSQASYTNRGTWLVLENMSNGKAFFAFSIANESYPRAGTGQQTYYTITISNVNQTITSSYTKGFGLRITSIRIDDNVDGSSTAWGIGSNVTDALQANGLFGFRTSATHQLRFTVNYQLYDLLTIGSLPDRTINQSFNITQNVL